MKPPFAAILADALRLAKSGNAPLLFEDGDFEHLERWVAHDPNGKILARIFARRVTDSTPMEAWGLILFVLECRRDAEKADMLNYDIPALRKKAGERAKELKKGLLRVEADSLLRPLDISVKRAIVAQIEAGLGRLDSDPVLSIRSDKDGSRARTIFCRILSDTLHYATGRWYDAAVADLCEIAFGCGDVTIGMVRSARKGLADRKETP